MATSSASRLPQRILVVGAGIAGLSVAWALAKQGVRGICVVDREPLPFSHSSARNAAIFRPAEEHEDRVEFALRSRQLLRELDPSGLMRPTPLLLVAEQERSLGALVRSARETSLQHQALSGEELFRIAPTLRGGRARYALRFDDAGVLDIHGIGQQLHARVRAMGVELRLGVGVRSVETAHGRVCGAITTEGTQLRANAIVLAAGAWCNSLAASCTKPLPLQPHRRHLAYLRPSAPPSRLEPVLWDVETGVYFRPESQGYLATPGDQTPHPASPPLTDPARAEQLARVLPQLSPRLSEARLQRMWACLRTLSADERMILGPDPLLPNLYWFAGLAGHGMSCGLAAGELLARAICTGQQTDSGSLGANRWAQTPADFTAGAAVRL